MDNYRVVVNMVGWRSRFEWAIWHLGEKRVVHVCYQRYSDRPSCQNDGEHVLRVRFGGDRLI